MLVNIPSNILIKRWRPQNDLLGHPNVKKFVTHGGQNGQRPSILASPWWSCRLEGNSEIMKTEHRRWYATLEKTSCMRLSTM